MGRKCLAFVTPDGGVSIIRPQMHMMRPDETEDAFLARVLAENALEDRVWEVEPRLHYEDQGCWGPMAALKKIPGAGNPP